LNIKSPIDNMNIDNIFATSSLHLESA